MYDSIQYWSITLHALIKKLVEFKASHWYFLFNRRLYRLKCKTNVSKTPALAYKYQSIIANA